MKFFRSLIIGIRTKGIWMYQLLLVMRGADSGSSVCVVVFGFIVDSFVCVGGAQENRQHTNSVAKG